MSHCRHRGRVVSVWQPVAHTSGRRLQAWGNLKVCSLAPNSVLGIGPCRARPPHCESSCVPCMVAGRGAEAVRYRLQATKIHFTLGLAWYLQAVTPEQLVDLYYSMYTDNYR